MLPRVLPRQVLPAEIQARCPPGHEPNGSGVGPADAHGLKFPASSLSDPKRFDHARFNMPAPDHGLKIFSTCPLSAQAQPQRCSRELQELTDLAPNEERYARLLEYTTVIQSLLRTADPVSFEGRYYKVPNLKLTRPLPPMLMPGVLVSGSSEAGMDAARQLKATAVEYPKPPAEYATAPSANIASRGIRIGIIAHAEDAGAWEVARTRYPEDHKRLLTRQLAMKVSDSSWHRQLSELGKTESGAENPYWLVPFQNYKAVCPFLVGSYDRVADEMAPSVDVGYRTFILDVAASVEEMHHTGVVFARAAARCLVA